MLLVDDYGTTNYLNKLLLTKSMQVTTQVLVAENGQIALDTLAQICTATSAGCPQLILLDMNMPVMNGREFLQAYAQLPIADFLSKPLTRAKMNDLLARHFA